MFANGISTWNINREMVLAHKSEEKMELCLNSTDWHCEVASGKISSCNMRLSRRPSDEGGGQSRDSHVIRLLQRLLRLMMLCGICTF